MVLIMKKIIHLQTQNIDSSRISTIKGVSWLSLCFDNTRISIDAYNGMGYTAEPREDCFIEIADEKEVFNLTAEQLLRAIRFFIAFSVDKDVIPHTKNKFHFIVRDAIKEP